MIKVSVIIPAYNAEKFIKNCIDSIINQTYKNIEIIIINDGSTDNTLQILNKIKDDRIRIISTENNGVSHARNVGINKSKGNYLLFVDADDKLELNAIELLVDYCLKYQPDIIRFNGYIETKKGKYEVIPVPKFKKNIYNSDDDYTRIINLIDGINNSLRCYSPLLFIKNDNIILFNESLSYLEDKVFYLQNFLVSNRKILFVDDCLYYYNYNENSKTKNVYNYEKNVNDIINSYEVISKIIGDYIPDYDCNTSCCFLIVYRYEFLVNHTSLIQFIKIVKKININRKIRKIFECDDHNYNSFAKISKKLIKHKQLIIFYLLCKIKKIGACL